MEVANFSSNYFTNYILASAGLTFFCGSSVYCHTNIMVEDKDEPHWERGARGYRANDVRPRRKLCAYLARRNARWAAASCSHRTRKDGYFGQGALAHAVTMSRGRLAHQQKKAALLINFRYILTATILTIIYTSTILVISDMIWIYMCIFI